MRTGGRNEILTLCHEQDIFRKAIHTLSWQDTTLTYHVTYMCDIDKFMKGGGIIIGLE
jgi:hypothetical protein